MIDYEAEYNNRARVPEFPQIAAQWTKAAAAYREAMGAEGRAELGVSYGSSPRQILDIFQPDAGPRAPLAVFIHGGYWRSLDPSSFSHLAEGLNKRGVAVALCGYDLCPQARIGDIIAQIRQACVYLWRRYRRRLFVFGHSAGGHLAAAMLATDWKALDPAVPSALVTAACSISGVFDLTPLIGITMNADLRLDHDEARKVSPLFWPTPPGAVFDLVVGGAESSEFLRQSRAMADHWAAGAQTRYEAIDGANHFTVLEPLRHPHSALCERLADLAAHHAPAAE